MLPPLDCLNCGKHFTPHPRAQIARYCSDRCRDIQKRIRIKAGIKLPPMSTTWTKENDDYLRLYYCARGVKRCAKEVGKSPASTMSRARRLGLRIYRQWDNIDDMYVRDRYLVDGAESVAIALRRSLSAVRERAVALKVTKLYHKPTKPQPNLYTKRLAQEIAPQYNCTPEDVFAGSRIRKVVDARYAIAARLRTQPWKYSYTRIGRILGVDHSTVISGLRRHAEIMAQQQREAAE